MPQGTRYDRVLTMWTSGRLHKLLRTHRTLSGCQLQFFHSGENSNCSKNGGPSFLTMLVLFQVLKKQNAQAPKYFLLFTLSIYCPHFYEGCRGSSSRLSCHTSRSSFIFFISPGVFPKKRDKQGRT